MCRAHGFPASEAADCLLRAQESSQRVQVLSLHPGYDMACGHSTTSLRVDRHLHAGRPTRSQPHTPEHVSDAVCTAPPPPSATVEPHLLCGAAQEAWCTHGRAPVSPAHAQRGLGRLDGGHKARPCARTHPVYRVSVAQRLHARHGQACRHQDRRQQRPLRHRRPKEHCKPAAADLAAHVDLSTAVCRPQISIAQEAQHRGSSPGLAWAALTAGWPAGGWPRRRPGDPHP